MNLSEIKLQLFLLFLLLFLLLPRAIWAQMGEYEQLPRIRSYLQRPAVESGRYTQDLRIPSVTTEEELPQRGVGKLPEMLPFEIPEYSQILIDKKIDPETYIIGPGDLLSIYFWGELDQQYTPRVTPEGYVVIPTVGRTLVSDYTLKEAEQLIKKAVNEKYKDLDITINLLLPRRLRCSISGVVENPGMYEAHSLTRVSDLLVELVPIEVQEQMLSYRQSGSQQTTEMFQPTDFFEGKKAGLIVRSQAPEYRRVKKGSSKRAIIISRNNEEIPVDLLRFEKMGDLDANPYVSGGDNIIIQPYIGDIYISGEVNSEGTYEFKPGDRIYDMVAFGGGLTSLADTANATLVRFKSDGLDIENKLIDLYDALLSNPDDPDYLLKESDRLFINTKYDYKVIANVSIEGEVKFPGEYAITPDVTRLSEFIAMAGGFTDRANLEESSIRKPYTSAMRDLEYERLRRMTREEMSDEEYEYYKMRSRTYENIITIDFIKLFEQNDESQDIFLESNDRIIIPMKRELINVLGAVQEPGYVRIQEGENINYYINSAGGFNWNAKTRAVRVIKAKTGQHFKPGNVSIEGGDTILIPEKKPIDYWELFMNSVAVVADVATVIIVVESVINR
ncbi:SLBB domain-containing protein [Candidatus Latescibacterota bacterium]